MKSFFYAGLGASIVAITIVLVLGLILPTNSDENSDSIRVHGHWIIWIYNPDGSLAKTTEFDNALTANGKSTLARLLDGSSRATTGDGTNSWRIRGYSSTSPSPGISSQLFEIASAEVTNLQEEGLRLEGTTTVTLTGTLRQVQTIVFVSNYDGNSWLGGAIRTFTAKIFSAEEGISLTEDQVAQVSVTITFS